MAVGRDVRKGRFVEPGRFHNPVLSEVVHDEVDEFELVGSERLVYDESCQRFLGRTPIHPNQRPNE